MLLFFNKIRKIRKENRKQQKEKQKENWRVSLLTFYYESWPVFHISKKKKKSKKIQKWMHWFGLVVVDMRDMIEIYTNQDNIWNLFVVVNFSKISIIWIYLDLMKRVRIMSWFSLINRNWRNLWNISIERATSSRFLWMINKYKIAAIKFCNDFLFSSIFPLFLYSFVEIVGGGGGRGWRMIH